MTAPLVALENVHVTFRGPDGPVRALTGFSLGVASGECVALIGSNGSGKSTVLRALAGVVALDSGRIVYGAGAPPRVAILLQDPDDQFVSTSVETELRISAPPDDTDRVRQAIDAFALNDLLGRNPHKLSGGEKQRLAFATVWLSRPELLLLDEPTSFLDAAAAASCATFVQRLCTDGVAVVWAVHDADEHVRLYATRVVEIGTPAREPETPPARARRAPEGRVALEMKNVTFGYPDGPPVLEKFSLSVNASECVGLTGRNASGKTTALLLAGGALSPQRGRVTRDGAPFYAPQSPERLFFAETVLEELAFGLRRAGVPAGDTRTRAVAALERVGLDASFLERFPFHLSGGEMRRAAFAIVDALEPRIVLLDEPTSGLDRAGRAVLDHVIAAQLDRGACVLIASHDHRFLTGATHRVHELTVSTPPPRRM